MNKYKICFVIPYFGKLPQDIELFLESCKYNFNFNWILYTDDKRKLNYPSNIAVKYCTFEEFKNKIQRKFQFTIGLSTPKKLCDFKPAYGYILEEELQEYDFWGYCDLDQLFGDLNMFITDEVLEKYDKLFCLGHMTLFRNTKKINRLFMSEFEDETYLKTSYKQIFKDTKNYIFDEWPRKIININVIAKRKNIKTYYTENILDIMPFKSIFINIKYNVDENVWFVDETRKNFIVVWEKGKLYAYTKNKKGKLLKKEAIYVHIQKRKIKNIEKFDNRKSNVIIITPNKYYFLEKYNEDILHRYFRRIFIRNLLKIDETKKKALDMISLWKYRFNKYIVSRLFTKSQV